MQKLAKNQPEDYITQDFETLSSGRIYHTLNAMVVPRPIAFITTQNETRIINAAPFSWFNAVCTSPPIISVAIASRDGGLKDTAKNILKTKEFVINICHKDIAPQISKCAGDFSEEISEVELTNLDTLPSSKIAPPRIAQTKIQMECRLEKDLKIGDPPVNLILGRVLQVHFHKELLDNNHRLDVMKLDPLARLNGDFYASLKEPFEIKRG